MKLSELNFALFLFSEVGGNMTEFEVEGLKGRYTVAGFGYPPMESIAFASEVAGWTEQTGFGGERAWVSLRQISGPAEGQLFNVNSRRKKITAIL